MKDIEKYVKDNNIKRYLSYCLDCENLKKYIDMKEYEEQEGWNERVSCLEDYIGDKIIQYNHILAIENQDIEYMIDLIYGCEFDIEINKNGKINLIDKQQAYLGGIESYENFDTIDSALDRLSSTYLSDYYGIEPY